MKNSNNITYSFNRYHAAKVIISAYLTAYLHNADIKTVVHDRFRNQILEKYRIRDKDGKLLQILPVSPENKVRLQMLSNCLHYFTNPQNKGKLDVLKNSSATNGREQFYNELITEIVVLPEFSHAYLNGLSLNDVYQKYERDISSNTKPEDIEKRQLLSNCLNLFKNNQCRAEIDSLREQLYKDNPSTSDMQFAEVISANFPEIIFGTDKTKFAEIVLPNFVNAYTCGEDIKPVFDRFISRISNDNSTINREKRTVLENFLDHFKTAKMRKAINPEESQIITTDDNGQPLPAETISENILENSAEELLGDKKRKYDMSALYIRGMISSLQFSEMNTLQEMSQDKYGNTLIITQIGELTYKSGAEESEVGQFTILFTTADNTETRSAKVFAKIDFERLRKDEKYYEIFINELFSKNNINLSNSCKYLGEITPITRKQKIGKESIVEGIYQYQASEKYALQYDYLPLSAVVEYTRQQETKKTQSTDSSGR